MNYLLTPEFYLCEVSRVVVDALWLMYQTISIHKIDPAIYNRYIPEMK